MELGNWYSYGVIGNIHMAWDISAIKILEAKGPIPPQVLVLVEVMVL